MGLIDILIFIGFTEGLHPSIFELLLQVTAILTCKILGKLTERVWKKRFCHKDKEAIAKLTFSKRRSPANTCLKDKGELFPIKDRDDKWLHDLRGALEIRTRNLFPRCSFDMKPRRGKYKFCYLFEKRRGGAWLRFDHLILFTCVVVIQEVEFKIEGLLCFLADLEEGF